MASRLQIGPSAVRRTCILALESTGPRISEVMSSADMSLHGLPSIDTKTSPSLIKPEVRAKPCGFSRETRHSPRLLFLKVKPKPACTTIAEGCREAVLLLGVPG